MLGLALNKISLQINAPSAARSWKCTGGQVAIPYFQIKPITQSRTMYKKQKKQLLLASNVHSHNATPQFSWENKHGLYLPVTRGSRIPSSSITFFVRFVEYSQIRIFCKYYTCVNTVSIQLSSILLLSVINIISIFIGRFKHGTNINEQEENTANFRTAVPRLGINFSSKEC